MEAIGTLAGGIAHDFNNLLGGILGNVSLLKRYLEDQEKYVAKLERIEGLIESGAHLSRQLLGFARRGKYEVRTSNINSLIKNILDMFARTHKQIKIHTKYQNSVWNVDIDQSQFEQVILNLFVNASDAMKNVRKLFIETENVILSNFFVKPFMAEPGRYVMISVRDTGHGMDTSTKKRVFEPFFTTKEVGKGTGLGLASAYGIIQNHNGFINVYSEKELGTVFKIFIPTTEKEIKSVEKYISEISHGTGTILLVDDEINFLEVGEEMLEEIGYSVITAENGREAMEKLV